MPTDTDSPLAVIQCLPPAYSAADACRIAKARYGLDAEATPLVSERDQNFRLRTGDGGQYVLKIANAAEDAAVTDFQVRALQHIAAADCAHPRVPVVRLTVAGDAYFLLGDGDVQHASRVVSYLPGRPLDSKRLTRPLCRNLGRGLAGLGQALAGFRHPAESPSLLWDMRQAPGLKRLLDHVPDPALRALVGTCIDDFERHALPRFETLRWQVIHNDMNPANVLIDPAAPDEFAGIIDFGDMVYAPLIVDVAVGAAYLREPDGNPLTWIAEFVAGYHAVTPLGIDETDLLYDLVNTRLAATVAILYWRMAERGTDDDYLGASAEAESTAAECLVRLRELPREHVCALLRQVCASVTEGLEADDQPVS